MVWYKPATACIEANLVGYRRLNVFIPELRIIGSNKIKVLRKTVKGFLREVTTEHCLPVGVRDTLLGKVTAVNQEKAANSLWILGGKPNP